MFGDIKLKLLGWDMGVQECEFPAVRDKEYTP